MPKIVDKEQKRKEIATKSKELLLTKGIAQLTVLEVAQNAQIGKGTIYQYFKSKDDIVFAIIDAFIDQELQELDRDLEQLKSFEQKLYRYFDFILSSNESYRKKQLKSYLEYLSIALVSHEAPTKEFNIECRNKFQKRLEKIIDEAIEKKEIKSESKNLLKGLYGVEKGFVMLAGVEKDTTIDSQMREFLQTIIGLIQKVDSSDR